VLEYHIGESQLILFWTVRFDKRESKRREFKNVGIFPERGEESILNETRKKVC